MHFNTSGYELLGVEVAKVIRKPIAGNMNTIAHWIGQYGYGGLFTLLMAGHRRGSRVPDETLLTFVGYLVYKGDMHGYWRWVRPSPARLWRNARLSFGLFPRAHGCSSGTGTGCT